MLRRCFVAVRSLGFFTRENNYAETKLLRCLLFLRSMCVEKWREIGPRIMEFYGHKADFSLILNRLVPSSLSSSVKDMERRKDGKTAEKLTVELLLDKMPLNFLAIRC